MMMTPKNKLYLLLFCFINITLFSQERTLYKATIKNNNTKGFKVVTLTPNIRSIANSDLSDLRILDANKNQIPYFLQEKRHRELVTFIPIKNKLSFKKKSTEAILTNSKKKYFQNIILKVSNADAIKSCKIEGSEHFKQWFVISENIQFSLDNNSTESYNYYKIQFPRINYKYIKLTINDSLSAPLNIKNIGYFKREILKKEYSYRSLNYNTNISQKNKKTIIHVSANSAFEINKINFDIKAPELYKRNVQIYMTYKNNEKVYKNSITNLVLNSNKKNIFKNLHINKRNFIIEIDNKDNQPLAIEKINFLQKELFLVSDLKANQTYEIIAGDKKLKKPMYDLINFKNKIDSNLPVLNIENENIYIQKNTKTKVQKIFYEQAWFMWVSIILVALIIIFFTLSLIKQTEEL